MHMRSYKEAFGVEMPATQLIAKMRPDAVYPEEVLVGLAEVQAMLERKAGERGGQQMHQTQQIQQQQRANASGGGGGEGGGGVPGASILLSSFHGAWGLQGIHIASYGSISLYLYLSRARAFSTDATRCGVRTY